MAIIFEWDSENAKSNLIKHDVSFDEAITIWNDEFAVFLHDPNHSISEERFIMIGYSNKKQFTFCIVYR